MCGTKASVEQKQKLEDTMLELLEDCRQKELYCMHNNVEDLIESALSSKLLLINLKSQRLNKEKQKVKNIVEQATKRRTRITSCLKSFKVIHKESTIPLNKTPQISLVNVITHDLPTKEPEYSLSMGDEHLDTIPKKESDELIKSSVENLVLIPSESEDFSDIESECDVPICDDSSPSFTTFSNPLFDSNDDFSSSDDESFSDEDVPKENFKIYSNPLFDEEIISNTLIDSSPKFDYLLEEFSSELAHIDPIPTGIVDTNFDLEKEIHLNDNFLYENSSPKERNYENVDTIIESPSPSPIPVEDKLLSNDPLSLLENESFHFDRYYVPSSPRPPEKPLNDDDVYFNIKPYTGVFTKVVDDIYDNSTRELYVHVPNVLPTLPTLSPMIAPDFKASRARGFVLRSLELQSLA
ncbi:hypothetical protein Tco_0490174 [Tanacetum coccineum]